MEIIIKYDSIWGNSFISEPDETNNRKYIASLSSMNDSKNKDNKLDRYKKREISINTVYGVLYRLLGARAPLSKLLKEDDSFVSDLIKQKAISFDYKKSSESDEVVYLRNNSLSTDQNSYSGVPDESLLDFDILSFLDVMFYSREELLDYLLLDKKASSKITDINIIEISKKLEEIYKNKTLKIMETLDGEINDEYNKINEAYKLSMNMEKDIHSKANLGLLAINKSIFEFSKNNESAMCFLTSSGTFSGVSLNGNSFTLKDFMKKFAASKLVYGNPYQTDFWVLNPHNKEGKNMKFNKKLSKSTGVLNIKIDCDIKTAEKIKEIIDNSGVSSFYLGKKGLAYTHKIIL